MPATRTTTPAAAAPAIRATVAFLFDASAAWEGWDGGLVLPVAPPIAADAAEADCIGGMVVSGVGSFDLGSMKMTVSMISSRDQRSFQGKRRT